MQAAGKFEMEHVFCIYLFGIELTPGYRQTFIDLVFFRAPPVIDKTP
jgi:hypothetical protein